MCGDPSEHLERRENHANPPLLATYEADTEGGVGTVSRVILTDMCVKCSWTHFGERYIEEIIYAVPHPRRYALVLTISVCTCWLLCLSLSEVLLSSTLCLYFHCGFINPWSTAI